MKKIALLSAKSQVTLPKAFLEELKIGYRSELEIDIDGGAIVIRPALGSVVEEMAGSLGERIPKEKRGISVEKALVDVGDKIARHLVKKI